MKEKTEPGRGASEQKTRGTWWQGTHWLQPWQELAYLRGLEELGLGVKQPADKTHM